MFIYLYFSSSWWGEYKTSHAVLKTQHDKQTRNGHAL